MKKEILFSVIIAAGVIATTTVNATTQCYQSDGAVEFIPSLDPSEPVNPLSPNPEDPVNPIDSVSGELYEPGTNGPLSIDYASSFNFGVNKISNKNETYYARAQTYLDEQGKVSELVTPNYVQVTDNRGTNAGWVLTVKQNGQFRNDDTLNNVLTGAVITLTDAVAKSNTNYTVAPSVSQGISLDSAGAESIIMSASVKTGAGTWVDSWGEVETITEQDANGAEVASDVTKAVSLFVPGSTPKDAVSYKTSLTWTLSDVPVE